MLHRAEFELRGVNRKPLAGGCGGGHAAETVCGQNVRDAEFGYVWMELVRHFLGTS